MTSRIVTATLLALCSCERFSVEEYCTRVPTACHPTIVTVSQRCLDPHGGETVSLLGSGFNPDSQVTWDGEPVPTTWVDPAGITFVTPPGSGSHSLGVTMNGETATVPDPVVFAQPPEIVEVLDDAGSSLGGKSVRISARNLWHAEVSIGDVSLGLGGTPEARNGFDCADTQLHQLELTTRAHAPGLVDVSIRSPAGTATVAGGYAFIVPWRSLGTLVDGGTALEVQQLAFSKTDPATLHALTARGLYTSTDEGAHWSRETPDALGVPTQLVFDAASSRRYLGTSNGVWRSDAPGVWTQLDPARSFRAIAGSWRTSNRLFAIDGAGVWESDDAGDTWLSINGTLASAGSMLAIAVASSPTDMVVVEGGAPTDRSFYWTQSAGWRSSTALACANGGGCKLLSSAAGVIASLTGVVQVSGTSWAQLGPGGYGVPMAVSDTTPVQILWKYVFPFDQPDSFSVNGPDGVLPAIDLSPGLDRLQVMAATISAEDPKRILVATQGGQIWLATHGAQ